MNKVIVFAGTTEGYEVSRFLSSQGVYVYACVATEYGSHALASNEKLSVHSGRLALEEMKQLFIKEQPQMVLDATHPYAAEVTKNILDACETLKLPYYRILREEGNKNLSAVYVESVDAAVDFLNTTQGNVLLTTGSKELAKYTKVSDYKERLYARVLSLPSVMIACQELGFEGKNLIGMQGPFSTELNCAMLKQYNCRYLVTKDTGKAGGFQEKIDAALQCGAIPVIIGRPLAEQGMSLGECKNFLTEYFKLSVKQHVTLLGIGMGSEDTLTIAGKKAIDKAELIIGAKRMVDSVKKAYHHIHYEYKSEEIIDYINNHPEYTEIVIALSGDVGFYSGAKKLTELFHEKTDIICGISSVVYFMSKIGMSWDDAKITSSHGRGNNLISMIKHNKKVFSILGTKDGISELAEKLMEYDMGEVLIYVGENLSYDDEKIFVKKASELSGYEGNALSVVCCYNAGAYKRNSTHGIADEEFIRGKAPMTKEEIRTISLSKLCLTEDSICYDVGAGTGSVSIEMALRAYNGKVYAIEKKEDAVALIKENKRKFAADNLEVIEGIAPDAMEELPVPTHIFIGGSSGNLKDIVKVSLQKNPDVKIVINCITLETVSEALELIKEYEFEESEIVSIAASRSKNIGRYHMMMGENPIYIITCRRAMK